MLYPLEKDVVGPTYVFYVHSLEDCMAVFTFLLTKPRTLLPLATRLFHDQSSCFGPSKRFNCSYSRLYGVETGAFVLVMWVVWHLEGLKDIPHLFSHMSAPDETHNIWLEARRRTKTRSVLHVRDSMYMPHLIKLVHYHYFKCSINWTVKSIIQYYTSYS